MVTETEASQLLEKLYNEWYVATREQRDAAKSPKGPELENDSFLEKSKSKDKTNTSVETRPLSKIEETLMDRSIRKSTDNSKLSGPGMIRASIMGGVSQDETRIFSPGASNDHTTNRNHMFHRSQDSNAMWAGPGTRDSSNFANVSQQVAMKGSMTFGRAPNTAGG